ncbi:MULTISPECIES: YceI family protein [unclassified Cellulophaga]|uniref:YceI family protein n=1 Tax=unclassified Cellulophaga TaxID=2634405 RepID=UPI000C2BB9AE|nr:MULTISPECIES: YceI family protein [unclassified Cellulophaga]MDO6492304.1 hypothetical protein [Cellulophaga sp. 2_MG-2023]MDO6493254.1 hypothetical protein [Cellulophaga sp. 3_MG-2023]PKB44752.1 hypothetical protein AX016_2974 [Cellulophaga sp. RHA19]
MKKIKLVCVSLLAVAAFSCKNANKENSHNSEDHKNADHSHTEAEAQYTLVADSTKASFTAYKTTDKIGVGGTFKTVNIKKSNTGSTPLEALNGTEFSIPVSSLFTNDGTGTRDPKIIEFFFGVMKNTELISGVLKVEDDKASLDVTLNGETANIPLETEKLSDNKFTFTGVMNLENWNALDAVASINKACEALHTGADGVSKTWSDVQIKGEVLLAKK